MNKLVGLGMSLLLSVNAMAQVADAALTQTKAAPKQYLVIQNLATERTRVYEKCTETPGCAHKMVFETEMVVGTDKMRSDVGVYKISEWVKFFQGGSGGSGATPTSETHYPSWYDKNSPNVPKPGSGFKAWFKKEAMPYPGQNEMRGAFGWYTALVTPSATGQWMHGTVGWGQDGSKFIDVAHGAGTVGFFGNMFSDLGSHGCTRHENRAIAYLHSLVPSGSTLVKIYAKESLSDASLSRYADQQTNSIFNYTLTKEHVRQSNPRNEQDEKITSETSQVTQRLAEGKLAQDDVIESGSYSVDRYPSPVEITGKGKKSGKSGDRYDIGEENFIGTFLIDEGRVANYQHPTKSHKVKNKNGDKVYEREIQVDGISDFKSDNNPVPEYMIKN